MKHKVKAIREVNRRIGNTVLEAEEGQELELSTTDASIAVGTGDFEYLGEIPETAAEISISKEDELRKELSKKLKAELVETAEKLEIPDAATLNKEPLIEAIIAKQLVDGEGE